jgi:hypothetical protein
VGRGPPVQNETVGWPGRVASGLCACYMRSISVGLTGSRRSWSSRYPGAGGRTTWSGTSSAAWSSSRARAAPRHHGGHFGGVAAVAGMNWSSWARRSGRDAHDRADACAPRLLVGLWWWRDERARAGNVDGQGASELTGADRRGVRWKRDGSYDQRWTRAGPALAAVSGHVRARHRLDAAPSSCHHLSVAVGPIEQTQAPGLHSLHPFSDRDVVSFAARLSPTRAARDS